MGMYGYGTFSTEGPGTAENGANPKRVSNKPMKSKSMKKPSEKLAEREAAKDQKKSLGESLTQAALAMPQGTGMAGRFLNSTLGGAAAGATLGEALANLQEQKIQKGIKRVPKRLSDRAMSQ